jgi:hypothetical protein
MAIFFMKRYDGNSSRAAQELRLILEEHCPTHAKRYCQKWYQRHMNQMPIETDMPRRGRPRAIKTMTDVEVAAELKKSDVIDGQPWPYANAEEVGW